MFPSRRIVTSGGDVFRDEYSLTFDGVNESIHTDFVADYTNFTITAWIKLVADTDVKMIFDGRPEANEGIKYYIDSSERLILRVQDLNSPGNSNVALTVGVWQHVACTYDGSTIYLYIDGEFAEDASGSKTVDISDTYGAKIGGKAFGSTEIFNGKMSEVTFYDTPLSASQIKTLYNGREPYNHSDGIAASNLKAWWRMGDGVNDGEGDSLTQLISDVTDITTGTVITPNLSDNASMNGSNWTGSAANEWTITTNTATSFGAITDADFASGAATILNYISSANSGMSAHLPVGAYKITGTLATAGTLPANTCALAWYGSSTRTHTLTVGDFIIYEVANSASPNHQFKFVATAEGQSFTLSNVKITPLNGGPGVTINMAATNFTGDTL